MFDYVMDTTTFPKKLIRCAGNQLPKTIDEAEDIITVAIACCWDVCDIADQTKEIPSTASRCSTLRTYQ